MTGPPNSAPTFDEGSSTTRSVAENTVSGSNVGAAVSATDADAADTLVYSLTGTDASSFSIVASSGQLQTSAALDYETKSSYSVTIGVSDGNNVDNRPDTSVDATISVAITVDDDDTEAPDAPAAPTVWTDSTTSLLVGWSAPANAGPAIDDYDVQYKKSSESAWTEWQPSAPDSTNRGATITGLDEDTAYEVQVRAENPEGDGPWSDSGTARTARPDNRPPTFPGGTYTLSVAENTTGTIGAPVTATDPESAELAYSLSGSDAASFSIDSGTAQLSVPSSTDLNYEGAKQSYSFDVVAEDPDGLTAARAVTITLTDDDTEAPGTPAAPVVTTLSSSELRADWAAPSNTGPEITGYDARYRAAGTASWTSRPGGAATSATIGGLAANTSYDVQIRAVNPEGTSEWSGSGSGTTSPGGPAPPPVDQQPFFLPGTTIDDLALVVGSAVSVTLPAATGGDPPLRYALTPLPPDGIRFDPETRVLSGTPTRISGALTYTYTATDSDGDGASLRFAIRVSSSSGGQRPSFGEASVADQTFTVGVTARLELPAAFGGDGDLRYSLSPAPPPGLGFDPETRVLSGTPTRISGALTYTYTATDSDGDGASLRFAIRVSSSSGGQRPSFGEASVADQTFTVGVTARLELPAAFGGDGELRYSLSPAPPPGLGFDAGSRVLWGTPVSAVDASTWTYRVTDGDGRDTDSDELRFTIAVAPAPSTSDQPDLAASPAGQESVALILGPGWADRPRSEIAIEVRGPKHGWMTWVPQSASSRLGAGAANGAATAGVSGILVAGLDADSPYTFRLRAETAAGVAVYSSEASATTGWFGGACRRGAGFLCLRDDRFEVRADWKNPDREADFGSATAIPLPVSDESGMFWFFNPDNVELVLKVLDGRWINEHFWVFFGALSDVEYWVTVNDTATGEVRTYHNPPKEVCGQNDTAAFLRPLEPSASASPASAASSSSRGSDWERAWGREPGVLGVDLVPMNAESFAVEGPAAAGAPESPGGVCEPSAERLCLLDDRFAVEVRLIDPNVQDPAERERVARVLPTLTTRETGFFWFFNDENVELAVKMLDGRAINGRFWLLYGGLSDVEYEIAVTDTWTGMDRIYRNEAGSICGEVDTGAFQ